MFFYNLWEVCRKEIHYKVLPDKGVVDEEISFPPPDEYTLREVELEAERLRKKQIEAVKKALKRVK